METADTKKERNLRQMAAGKERTEQRISPIKLDKRSEAAGSRVGRGSIFTRMGGQDF